MNEIFKDEIGWYFDIFGGMGGPYIDEKTAIKAMKVWLTTLTDNLSKN